MDTSAGWLYCGHIICNNAQCQSFYWVYEHTIGANPYTACTFVPVYYICITEMDLNTLKRVIIKWFKVKKRNFIAAVMATVS
jgi:hypothetical protein